MYDNYLGTYAVGFNLTNNLQPEIKAVYLLHITTLKCEFLSLCPPKRASL